MLKIKDDDYIISEYRGKPTLMLVLNGKSRRCVVEKTLVSDEPENIQVEHEDIIANLGSNPRYGKAFGIDIKPYVKTISTKRYGPIHVFRKLEKNELKRLKKSMDSVYALFKKKATVSFLPLHQTSLEPKSGKYAGSYTFKQKGLECLDKVTLKPETFSDPEYNEYILAHEWAHGLWYRCVSPQLRARWLKLYQKRLTLSQIDESELSSLCEDVVGYEGGLRAYSKEIGDDHVQLVLKEVVDYYKKYHKMDLRSVELLLREDSSSFADLWPTSTHLTEQRPDISDYSMTKVEEFFAEAVAFYIVGRVLPKDVQKGIDFTMKRLGSVVED